MKSDQFDDARMILFADRVKCFGDGGADYGAGQQYDSRKYI